MSERVRKQWEALGASDPYWAVLTHADKKGGKWNKDEFFATGAVEIAGVVRKLADLGITPEKNVALDYGCGVGRLSRALAQSFTHVIGVDISRTMLDEARAATPGIDFRLGNGSELSGVGDASVDLVYSNIVLQHSPPENQRSLIREFCRVLAPGGALVFQTPSHESWRTPSGIVHRLLGNRGMNVLRRLRYGKDGVMELHALDRIEVLQLLAHGGTTTLAVERHDSAGAAFVSFMYYAIKRAP